jgi:hypothetical protein
MDPEIADANIRDERSTAARSAEEMQVGTNGADENALQPFPFEI